jgi:hypothetical protein
MRKPQSRLQLLLQQGPTSCPGLLGDPRDVTPVGDARSSATENDPTALDVYEAAIAAMDTIDPENLSMPSRRLKILPQIFLW